MTIALMNVLLVAGLVAGSLAGQTAGGGNVAIEAPDIAPPSTLRGMWDVSPVVIVGRVMPNDSQKPDAGGVSRGVRDSSVYTYTVRPIEVLKGSGLGESLRVIVSRTLTTERWSPGDEYLLFLKRTSERGTYHVTSATWYLMDQGLFIVPGLVRNSYFGGRSKIPKDELLSKLRQMR